MAQAKLSERERVSVLMMRGWGDQVRSYDPVRLLFNRTLVYVELVMSVTLLLRQGEIF